MNKKEIDWKEARELIVQPGKGRYGLLTTVLEREEILGDSIALLLHRLCSRLQLRREDVGYNGFYCWVRNYRQTHLLNATLPAEAIHSEGTKTVHAPFRFSDPSSISNPSTTDIKFH